MPGGISGNIKGNGTDPSRTTTVNNTTKTTPTFQDPEFVKAMETLIGNLSNFGSQNFQSYIKDPTSSPLFQTQLAGALAKLAPSEDMSRRNLTDQFRAAGGLRSGAYGNSASLLEEAILGNRGKTAADVLGSTYGPTLSGLLHPIDQLSSLIAALKGQTTEGTQTTITPEPLNFGGGAGGGGGGGGSSTPYYNSLFGQNPGNPTAPSGGNGYGGLPGVSNNGGSQTWYTPDFGGGFDGGGGSEPGILGGGSGEYYPGGFFGDGGNDNQGGFDFSQYDGGGY